MNVNLHKKINNNSNIDYVGIFPHAILFGTMLSYCINKEVVTVIPNDENTVIIKDIKDCVLALFLKLKTEQPPILFIKFDENIKTPDIGQILENMSKFLKRLNQMK